MRNVTRSQDEILARMLAAKDNDILGFKTEALLYALDFEHAKQYLVDGATAEAWDAARPDDLMVEAAEYLDFAIGKINGHRGISASRSVEKLREYAWLLGRDDVVNAMNDADYPQYGAPQVKAFAVGMGFPWPDDADLARMAEGLPCSDECVSGCG